MKWRGWAFRISSAEPSVEPESITISSQLLYAWVLSAGSVSRNAHASLYERMIMLTNGSAARAADPLSGVTSVTDELVMIVKRLHRPAMRPPRVVVMRQGFVRCVLLPPVHRGSSICKSAGLPKHPPESWADSCR